MSVKKASLTFIRKYCKGCGICVRFCPAGVMELQGNGRLNIIKPKNCTGCGICELRCPDFAITVEVQK